MSSRPSFEEQIQPSPIKSLASTWSKLPLMDKIIAAALSSHLLSAALNGINILREPNAESEVLFGGSTVASAVLAGIAISKHKKNNERSFSGRKNFVDYVHLDAESDGRFVSPFAVTVVGINHDVLLGAGKVIGGIEDKDGDVMPVIAIQDDTSPKGEVQLLGSECYWSPMDEELAEYLADSRASALILPASVYVRSLEY